MWHRTCWYLKEQKLYQPIQTCSRCITDPTQLTAQSSTGSSTKTWNPLTSRVEALANRIDDATSPKSWAQSLWHSRWNNVNHQLETFISVPTPKPPEHDLRRKKWVFLNRIHSGHGRYACFMHNIGARDNRYCNCVDVETPQYVLCCSVIGITGDIINADEEFLQLSW